MKSHLKDYPSVNNCRHYLDEKSNCFGRDRGRQGKLAVFRDTQEQVIGHLAFIVEDDNLSTRIERTHQPVGDEGDPTLGESCQQSFGGSRRWRNWDTERHDQADLASRAYPPAGEIAMNYPANHPAAWGFALPALPSHRRSPCGSAS